MLTRRGASVLCLAWVLAAAAFAPTLRAGFLWDDFQLFVRNQRLHSATFGESLRQKFWDTSEPVPSIESYYRPVVRGALWLQWRWFGENAVGYHLINILLHGLCTALLAALLLRRLKDTAEPRRFWAVFVGAAVFALHPSRVESVGWISGSTDLWMTAWLLGGALLWTSQLSLRLGISCACFALALFAKETAIAVPAILLLDLLCLSPSEDKRDGFKAWALVTLSMAGALALRMSMAPAPGSTTKLFQSFLPRVLATVGEYVARTVWPWPVSFLWTSSSTDDIQAHLYAPWVIALGAVALGLTLVCAILAGKRHSFRPWVADLGWYFLPLAPLANLIPFDRPYLSGSRFLYLPMVGLSFLLARLVTRIPVSARFVVEGAAVGLGLAYTVTVVPAQAHLKDETALWKYEADVNPNNRSPNENFARLMMQQRKPDQAIVYLKRALQDAKPLNVRARLVLEGLYAETLATPDSDPSRLLTLKSSLDAFETGKVELRWPLRSGEVVTTPVDATIWSELRSRSDIGDYFGFRGTLCLRSGDAQCAIQSFRDAVNRAPRHPGPRRTLISAFAAAGLWDDALGALEETSQSIAPQSWTKAWDSQLRAAKAAAQSNPQTFERVVVQANVLTSLGLPIYARRLLEPFRAEHGTELLFQQVEARADVGSSRVDLQACKLEYSIVSPK